MTWRTLLRGTSAALALLFGVFAVVIGDRQSFVWATVLALLTALLWSRLGRYAAMGIAVMAAATLLFLGWATVANVGTSVSTTSVGMTAGLAALSLLPLAGWYGLLFTRRNSGWPVFWIWVGFLAFLGALVPFLFAGSCACLEPGLSLIADDVSYSKTEVTIEAGERSVSLTNRDLFWHTFTISEIDFNLTVPARGSESVMVQIPPGTYEFFCRVPGNSLAGMSGTLVASAG